MFNETYKAMLAHVIQCRKVPGSHVHTVAHIDDLTFFVTVSANSVESYRFLDVQCGRWTAPEIIQRLTEIHREHGSSMIVTANGAKEFLVARLREQGISVLSWFERRRTEARAV